MTPKAPRPRPTPPLSDNQRAQLRAIRSLMAELGDAPSVKQIAARLGISKQGAQQALRAFERRGLALDLPKVVSSGKWALTAAGEGETR